MISWVTQGDNPSPEQVGGYTIWLREDNGSDAEFIERSGYHTIIIGTTPTSIPGSNESVSCS